MLRTRSERARLADLAEWRKQPVLDRWFYRNYYAHYARPWMEPATLQSVSHHIIPGEPVPQHQYFAGRAFHASIPAAKLDPDYAGWTIVMDFAHRRDPEPTLISWNIVPPDGLIQGPSASWWALEQIRVTALGLGMIFWIAGIAIVLAVRGARRMTAPIMMGAALVCVVSAATEITFSWASIAHPLRPGTATRSVDVRYPFAWVGRIATHPALYDTSALAALFSIVLWIIPARRSDPSHCAKCAYDLTGNVSGICPECGTETPRHKREHRLAELAPAADRLNCVTLIGAADGIIELRDPS